MHWRIIWEKSFSKTFKTLLVNQKEVIKEQSITFKYFSSWHVSYNTKTSKLLMKLFIKKSKVKTKTIMSKNIIKHARNFIIVVIEIIF